MSQDGEGEELPGQRGPHQRQPGRHRHQGQGEPRLQGGHHRELLLFLVCIDERLFNQQLTADSRAVQSSSAEADIKQ